MPLFQSFRILVGILLHPSLLFRWKKEMMLDISKLSVAVTKNNSILKGKDIIKIFFLEKSDGQLNIDSNFSETVIKGIHDVKRVNDCLKLVSAILIKFLFFHQMIAFQKLWKMLFISSKKLFSFSRYSIFCISVLPSFLTCWPLLWRMIED